jgi:hypothetical protein
LASGLSQEEILFCQAPELIATRLFVEDLLPNEAIEVSGFEYFSKYGGYEKTLHYKGDLVDSNKDKNGNFRNKIICVDAFRCEPGKKYLQYEEKNVKRDLIKFYVGCCTLKKDENNQPKVFQTQNSSISTGFWGSGNFGGDKQLKALFLFLFFF